MTVSGLDLKLSGAACTTCLPPFPSLRPGSGLTPQIGGAQPVINAAENLWSAASGDQKASPREELQEVSWAQFFAEPRHWWDSGRSKSVSGKFVLPNQECMVALWLFNPDRPASVDWQQATLGAGLTMTPHVGITMISGFAAFAAHDGHFNVAFCRKLCDDGRISDAVDALHLLVKRGSYVPNNLFYRVLKRCIKEKDLVLGRRIHSVTVQSGYEGDTFLATHLIGLYASHGKLEEAVGVFTKIPTPDAYNWAAIISAYARLAEPAEAAEAIRLYRQMCKSIAVKPDDRIFSAVLKACATARDLGAGKEVHAHILKNHQKPDIFVQAGLVNMYAKCGSLKDARELFDQLSERDVVTWTAMIAGYAQQGMGHEALFLYRKMQLEGLTPNSVTYVCLLQACASVGVEAIDDGKQLHAHIRTRGLQDDVVIGVSLVHMYAKCGSLEDARRLFDTLSSKDVVTWTALIAAYAQQGMGQESLSLYRSMLEEGLVPPDSVTYVCLLQACSSVGVRALDKGKKLHMQIIKHGLQDDATLCVSLVNMYAKCGGLENACSLFNKLPGRSVVAFNAILTGYSQQGMGQEALALYRRLQHEASISPNSITYTCLLQACATVGVGALDDGKELHLEIKQRGIEQGGTLRVSLVNMYAKCGSLENARHVFDKLPEKSVVAWNAMIAGYAQQGMGQEALHIYSCMQKENLVSPDCVTFVSLLQASASVGVGALNEGKQLHAEIRKRGFREEGVLGVSLVNMYAKCGSLDDALELFDKLPDKNVVAWNAVIAGYAQQGMGQEALTFYKRMQQNGRIPPNSVTYVCLLQACATLAALPLGEQLHAEIHERGLEDDTMVGAALINMYGKCGSMSNSQQVFDSLSERSVEVWGALVSGYARQGDSQVVFDLLDRMKLEGVVPNGVTFLSVLTVCSHAGLVDKGLKYFKAMSTDYGISATVEHFICMVDLLGRAGQLDEALHMAKAMPFPPNDVVWHTLLGACRKWKNVEIGQEAFQCALSVDATAAASYVLMSNIYASAGMWDAAKEMQARRRKLGAWKKPGQSQWTDIDGMVHTFLVGDNEHPESEGIYARLEQLYPEMKKAGYVPHLESSLLDMSDAEKEAGLCGHSEKLAIAYALNKTADGTTIRIVKNLRVCEDCHTATAYISKVENRTIICRDASRFHVFKEGKCSCGDYW